MAGLSAVEVGILTQDAAAIRSKIELLRDPSKVDPRSAVPPPNNCGQDEHDKLDRDVTSKCVESGVRTCNPTKPPFVLSNDEILRRFNLNKACAESREKLDKMCFFGGNKTHRQQTSDEWKATLNCLEKLGGGGIAP